jgi:hypothetical protein
VANLVNILNPQVVVLGGGVMAALADEMLNIVIETAKDYAMPGSLNGVEIIASTLGDNAGITGGAGLAKRMSFGTRFHALYREPGRPEFDEWIGGPARIRTENQSIMSALL